MTFVGAPVPSASNDRTRVVHLVDDTTPGGVMRYLDFLKSDATLAEAAEHILRPVNRGEVGRLLLDCEVIVSHLSVNWRALPGLIALRARHASARLIHVEHSYTAAFTALNVRSRVRFFTLLRSAYALFDKVVAVSAAQGEWLRGRGLVTSDRLEIIRPAVDLSDFAALPAPRAQPRVIGAFGRLDRQKGFDTLVSAFRKVPGNDRVLRLHGAGADLAMLKSLAAGDARIQFLGHVADPSRAMAEVDIVAMPSRWEAYGIAALEARVAGRPLVVTSVDGLRDHAGPGVTLVRPGAVDELADALLGTTRCGQSSVERRALAIRSEAATRDGWSRLILRDPPSNRAWVAETEVPSSIRASA
ncbi:glycosyltransferase (plasmid) [Salipiger sp. H15]|uniref:Glycosyltransferase n=1 Tax=Alloyangia sp. H15 TaxID=3029062 RepID=A0AAU8ASJ5_9RHOB